MKGRTIVFLHSGARSILLSGLAFCAYTSTSMEDAEVPASSASNPPATNLLVGSPSGQSLTAGEAKQALQRLHAPAPGPGTWRHLTIDSDLDSTGTNTIFSTNIIYEWRGPEGQRFSRREESVFDTAKSRTQRYLQMTNEEGGWALHERVAILFPQPRQGQKSGASFNLSNNIVTWPLSLSQISGERFEEGGHSRLRIIEWSEERARKSVDTQAKELKKKIPLLIRPFVPKSFLETAVEHVIPVRQETVMDEETGVLIVRRIFARDGGLLEQVRAWELCPDLPAAAYAVPEGVRRIRPKTVAEAKRLESETRAQEEKSAK